MPVNSRDGRRGVPFRGDVSARGPHQQDREHQQAHDYMEDMKPGQGEVQRTVNAGRKSKGLPVPLIGLHREKNCPENQRRNDAGG